jgi:vancomycin aglycone glucosyltransferase
MARILVASHGSRGDIQPLLALAVGLKAAGHDVEMSAPPDFCDWINSHGLLAHGFGHNMRELVENQGGKIMKNPLTVLLRMVALMRENLIEQHKNLIPLAEKFDTIVASSLQLSAFSAAEYWQIPYTYLVYCPNLIASDGYMPMVWPWPVLTPQLHKIAWFFEIKGWQMALGPVINSVRKDFELAPLSNLFAHFLSDNPMLAAYQELAPGPKDRKHNQVPALHLKASDSVLPKDLEDYLQAGSAPIYLGFGSMNDGKAEATTAAIVKLAKQRKERFVLSRGWGGLGNASLPENIHLVDAVSHDLLFPRLRGVIHHGGAGTTSASARAGVPQLIVPHLLDQNYWAHAIHNQGLGPPGLSKRQLTTQSLEQGLQRLIRPEYQLRAQALGKRLREQDGVAQAIQFIEAGLAHKK